MCGFLFFIFVSKEFSPRQHCIFAKSDMRETQAMCNGHDEYVIWKLLSFFSRGLITDPRNMKMPSIFFKLPFFNVLMFIIHALQKTILISTRVKW